MSGDTDCIWIPILCRMSEDVIFLSCYKSKGRALKRPKSYPSMFCTPNDWGLKRLGNTSGGGRTFASRPNDYLGFVSISRSAGI